MTALPMIREVRVALPTSGAPAAPVLPDSSRSVEAHDGPVRAVPFGSTDLGPDILVKMHGRVS
jgi:hypothetical protein